METRFDFAATSNQELLPFDSEPEPVIQFADTNLEKEEKPRLSRQCREILERLKQGTATNKELAAIALKYTSRISDLRASGYDVRIVSRDRKSGIVVYGARLSR